jgi:intracellular multiplication protein IcmO
MGPSPYFVVLDELAYYATSGLDRMLAQGRSLNVSFMLGFQEVSGIWARLGEKTASLLGNANLTIAMRQQDSGRTREWIEKTAGQTYVTQATTYQGGGDGAYREAQHAEVRPVSRVDWNDLTSLIEGEAIVLFGGRRIYARVFHAKVDDSGPKRLGRTVVLAAPDREQVCGRLQRLGEISAMIERGGLVTAGGEEASPVLDALRDGFIAGAKVNAGRPACAQAALAALATLPESALPPRPPPPADGSPVTAVTPMLKAAAQGPIPGPTATETTGETGSVALARSLTSVERLAGLGPIAARSTAMLAVSDREAALAQIARVEPPAMTADALCGHLRLVLVQLHALRSSRLRRAA